MSHIDDLNQDTICNYVKYLINNYGLNLSIHLSMKYLYLKCNDTLDHVFRYGMHINPYCVYVQNAKLQHRKCVLCQYLVCSKIRKVVSYNGTCHAGVREYIRRIMVGDEPVGFVSVSGYKDEKRAVDDKFYASCLKDGPIPNELLDTLIPPLCAMLSQYIYRVKDIRPQNGVFTQIVEYLEDNHGAVTLEDISKRFNYSKSYISHMFKKECGLTLKAYCNRLKIEDAQRLLDSTDISVTDIAYMVGFNDLSYFINTFRKMTGMTALEYRKSDRKKYRGGAED